MRHRSLPPSLWGLAAIAACGALALWVSHQRNLLPGSRPEHDRNGLAEVDTYAALVHKHLAAFFGCYQRSLIKGSLTSQGGLAAMVHSARKVEEYMHELEFRRCNDLVASERHLEATRTLLRALEAYLEDAAARNNIPYIARVL